MVGPNWDRKIHDCDGPTRDVFSSGRSESHLKMKKKIKLFTTNGDLLMQFNDFLLPTPKLKVILKSKEILVDKINFAASLCSAVQST